MMLHIGTNSLKKESTGRSTVDVATHGFETLWYDELVREMQQ